MTQIHLTWWQEEVSLLPAEAIGLRKVDDKPLELDALDRNVQLVSYLNENYEHVSIFRTVSLSN